MSMTFRQILLAGGMACGSAMCASAAQAAITVTGSVPAFTTAPGLMTVLQAHGQPGVTDSIRLKLSALTPTPGVAYDLMFCVGPAAAPCGPGSKCMVTVPINESRLAVIPSSLLEKNVLIIQNYVKRAAPYSVTME